MRSLAPMGVASFFRIGWNEVEANPRKDIADSGSEVLEYRKGCASNYYRQNLFINKKSPTSGDFLIAVSVK